MNSAIDILFKNKNCTKFEPQQDRAVFFDLKKSAKKVKWSIKRGL